jgi:hypothetical protein
LLEKINSLIDMPCTRLHLSYGILSIHCRAYCNRPHSAQSTTSY